MVVRKIVHQYIGNLVSQSSWSYLWLNEGIAAFLAMKIVQQVITFNFLPFCTIMQLKEKLIDNT